MENFWPVHRTGSKITGLNEHEVLLTWNQCVEFLVTVAVLDTELNNGMGMVVSMIFFFGWLAIISR